MSDKTPFTQMTPDEMKGLAEMLRRLPSPKLPSEREDYEGSLTVAGARLYDRETMTASVPPGRAEEG